MRGKSLPNNKVLVATVEEASKLGADGVAIGRNVFQAGYS